MSVEFMSVRKVGSITLRYAVQVRCVIDSIRVQKARLNICAREHSKRF